MDLRSWYLDVSPSKVAYDSTSLPSRMEVGADKTKAIQYSAGLPRPPGRGRRAAAPAAARRCDRVKRTAVATCGCSTLPFCYTTLTHSAHATGTKKLLLQQRTP